MISAPHVGSASKGIGVFICSWAASPYTSESPSSVNVWWTWMERQKVCGPLIRLLRGTHQQGAPLLCLLTLPRSDFVLYPLQLPRLIGTGNQLEDLSLLHPEVIIVSFRFSFNQIGTSIPYLTVLSFSAVFTTHFCIGTSFTRQFQRLPI